MSVGVLDQETMGPLGHWSITTGTNAVVMVP